MYSHVGELADRLRAVALGKLGAVRAVDHRQVPELRQRPAHALVDVDLPGGVVQVVVAPDHVGDPHVVVVGDDSQVVGRRAVGAQQDEVVELAVAEHDVALDQVVDDGLALPRRAQAHDERLVVARRGRPVAPRRADGPALGARHLALLLQFLDRHVVAVSASARQQLHRDGAVPIGAGMLEDGRLVGLEPKPRHAFEDRLHRVCRRALAVGVLDADQELAAHAARVQPVEKRGAGCAYVHHPGWRRGDAGDDGGGGV